MPLNVGMFIKLDLRLGGMLQVIGVDAVDHIHMMTLVPQDMRQAVDIHRVPAKTIRWVESGQMQEIEGAVHA